MTKAANPELVDQVCDKTSIGAIVRDKNGRFLMILRKNYPYGYAPPAGHCDDKTYQNACFDEVFEETGLKILKTAPTPLIVKNPRKNKCRRGGEHHYWQVLEFDQRKKPEMVLFGELRPESGGTKWAGWLTMEEIRCLARKTDQYLMALSLVSFIEDLVLVEGLKRVIEEKWRESPGLEVEWFIILQELNII